MDAQHLYLDLLKKILTNTLVSPEPDADSDNASAYVMDFTRHYIRGAAFTMLPSARLDNLRDCVIDVVRSGVPGDLIETGVWRGGASIYMRGVLATLGVTDRTVWVADSFEGLPEPDAARFPKEAAFHNSKMMQDLYDRFAVDINTVTYNFELFGLLDDQVRFLKGWFKDTLPSADIEQLAVMRLDGDYYESTSDSLNSLYGRLSLGGYVIVDDYGEDAWTECRRAVDEFRAAHGINAPMIQIDSKCFYWKKSESTFESVRTTTDSAVVNGLTRQGSVPALAIRP